MIRKGRSNGKRRNTIRSATFLRAPSANPSGIQLHQPQVARLARPARTELPWVTFPKKFSTLKAVYPSAAKSDLGGAGRTPSQSSHLALPERFINWILNSRNWSS